MKVDNLGDGIRDFVEAERKKKNYSFFTNSAIFAATSQALSANPIRSPTKKVS